MALCKETRKKLKEEYQGKCLLEITKAHYGVYYVICDKEYQKRLWENEQKHHTSEEILTHQGKHCVGSTVLTEL